MMATDGALSSWRRLSSLVALLLLALAAHSASSTSPDSEYPSCMRDWFMEIGIPDASAKVYVNKTQFYTTINLTVETLRHTRHPIILKKLGVHDAQHRDAIVACSLTIDGCPLDPCLNEGECRYADAKRRFECSCRKSWTGDRCEARLSGKMNKAQMRAQNRQQRKKEAWLEARVNVAERELLDREMHFSRTIAQQLEELETLRAKIELKEARNKERRTKLVNTRKRASNSSREAQACKKLLIVETSKSAILQKQLSSCTAELGFPFTAQGCGNRRDGRDGLSSGSVLGQGEEMLSRDGNSRLRVLANGTIQAYDRRGVFWSSPDRVHRCAHYNGPYRLVVARTGEIQSMDNSNCVVWSSGTRGHGYDRNVCLLLGNSRRLSLYAPCGQMLWTSGPDPNRTIYRK